MTKLKDILFSTKLTLVLLVFFAISVGLATFIEHYYDTETAKHLIYSARWLEISLLLMSINLLGVTIKRKLYRKGKRAIFLFHIGFVTMIIGAAVTRYVGFEGTMHIREGASSDEIFISESHVRVGVVGSDVAEFEDIKMERNDIENIPFTHTFSDKLKGKIKLEFKAFYPSAQEQIIENVPNGVDMLEYRVAAENGNTTELVTFGEVNRNGSISFSYGTVADTNSISITSVGDSIFLTSPVVLFYVNEEQKQDTIAAHTKSELMFDNVYVANDVLFLFVKHYKSAKKQYSNGTAEANVPDVVLVDVVSNNKRTEIALYGGEGYYATMKTYNVANLTLSVGYGSVPLKLPFSLYLEDFILQRYPGSMSPSSFESDVILKDERTELEKKYKIYMNNILDHDGYRFFQSSYDRDEKGTVLSVNHDRPGAIITYISYVMFTLGFILIFFAKGSRARLLMQRMTKTRVDKKTSAILALVVLSSFGASAQTQKAVSKAHADKFGKLVVQTFDGRFQPVHTLALDVVHKITKKNSISTKEKGTLNGMQFFMDLLADNTYWESQKIIFIKDAAVLNMIGVKGKYAAYTDFFDATGTYKLAQVSEDAYRKSKAEQGDFDKEIIKVNERLNILLMTFDAEMLKVFPDENSADNSWVSVSDSASYMALTGSAASVNKRLGLSKLTYATLFKTYFEKLTEGIKTGNYTEADQIIGYISEIQKQSAAANILPSETKVQLEVYYNKARIFVVLKFVYMILSLIMLVLAFAEHLSSKKNKLVSGALRGFIGITFLAFLYHTYGLGLRWYLSGHAPWSNGYEVLITVAWGAILAGFIFMRYSKITLAATVLLAFLITMTAGFSNYDPQLTNLQPVLKSYWLIIHVAIIVISYCFLGLAFILGLMSLVLYAVQNSKNHVRFSQTVKELTNINELNMHIGIVMATIGTFLGAVWANESWGRYWGWDAKETWALVILMVYAVVLHMRLVPKLNNILALNIGSVLGFSSVIMTFFGVNYYFTKGMHSYASGDKAAFPLWAWIALAVVLWLIALAWKKYKFFSDKSEKS